MVFIIRTTVHERASERTRYRAPRSYALVVASSLSRWLQTNKRPGIDYKEVVALTGPWP